MTDRPDPFAALGLPTRPGLTDAQVHAAWRQIAADTHPDRPDGGNLTRYTQASAAYAEISTTWGRSEAYADLTADRATTSPLPVIAVELKPSPARAPARLSLLPLRLLPARIWHGHPLRLLVRALIAVILALIILTLIPGAAAVPADIAGVGAWFVLTGRADLAPPPGH